MTYNVFEFLKEAEKQADIDFSDQETLVPYKQFRKVWIRADISFWKIYFSVLKYSDIQFFPSISFKKWGVWLKALLKFRKGKRKKKPPIGIGMIWTWKEKIYLPIHADIIYIKGDVSVLVYKKSSSDCVIKIAHTLKAKNKLIKEIIQQKIALEIKSNLITIPEIIQVKQDNIFFKRESYFRGKKLNYNSKSNLNRQYKKVFSFMVEFYLLHPIVMKSVGEVYQNNSCVIELIENQPKGHLVLKFFRELSQKDKKLIFIQTHGDLSHFNILYKKTTTAIIDWGESEFTFLYKDFLNSSYFPKNEYQLLIERAELDSNLLFNFEEQLFLGRFIKMHNRVSEILKKNVTKSRITNILQSDLNRLMSILKFSPIK